MSAIYLVVCGASSAFRAGEIAVALAPNYDRVLVMQTPGAKLVVSPRELSRACEATPAIQIIDGYFDTAVLPRPPRAPVLIAPCTFNTLNKLAGGIADSFALSIVSEMLGLGFRIAAALSVNDGLWAHPRARASVATLRGWGITVIEPRVVSGSLTMATTAEILAAVNPATPGPAGA